MSFAAEYDAKRMREQMQPTFQAARAGLNANKGTPTTENLKNLRIAQEGLTGFQFARATENPQAQSFLDQQHTKHRGAGTKFVKDQLRDAVLGSALNMVAPGVGTAYSVLALIASTQHAVQNAGVMPAPTQQKSGGLTAGIVGSFAEEYDRSKKASIPSRLAQQGKPAIQPAAPGANIMRQRAPQTADQIRLESTVSHFNEALRKTAADIEHKETRGRFDLLSQPDLEPRLSKLSHGRQEQIVASGFTGTLGDAGVDPSEIKHIRRAHAPTPAQQMALAPAPSMG